jgi:hypothetical protein
MMFAELDRMIWDVCRNAWTLDWNCMLLKKDGETEYQAAESFVMMICKLLITLQ